MPQHVSPCFESGFQHGAKYYYCNSILLGQGTRGDKSCWWPGTKVPPQAGIPSTPEVLHRPRSERFLSLICWFLLLTQNTVSGLSLTPMVDIANLPTTQVQFNIINTTLTLFNHPNSMVLYATDLSYDRQMVRIDKLVDFTDVALSNMNMVHAMDKLVSINDVGTHNKFFIMANHEYTISNTELTFRDCQLFCASKSATMVFSTVHYYRVRAKHLDKTLWVKTETLIEDDDGVQSYQVMFQEKPLYPFNTVTYNKAGKVFFQKDNELVQTHRIQTYYIGYYDSQDLSYWPSHHYELTVRITPQDNVEVIIPVQNTVLSCAHAFCPCVRPVQETSRTFRDMKDELFQVKIQRQKLKLYMEPYRLSSGYVPRLLELKSRANITGRHSAALQQKIYKKKDFQPLVLTREKNNSSDLLLGPAFAFAAKNIGAPMVMGIFSSYYDKMVDELKGKSLQFFHAKKNFPDSVSVTGLTAEQTNFSIILKIDDFERFQTDVGTSMHSDTQLLRNLSHINDALESFIHSHLYDLVVSAAAENISATIDIEYPVIVVVDKSDSFYYCKLYFTTISNTPTSTNFRLMNLPHTRIGDVYHSLDLPEHFSSNGFHYVFENDFANKGLSSCIDQLLANAHSQECLQKIVPKTRLVRGFRIAEHFDLFYVLNEREPGHLKITCPGLLTHHNNLQFRITVLAISPTCNVLLVTDSGTFSVQPNISYHGSVKPPLLLFQYNVQDEKSVTDFHLILIISIAVVVFAVVLFIAILLYYIFGYQSAHLVEVMDPSYRPGSPTSSEESVETIRAVQSGRHVSFNTTV